MAEFCKCGSLKIRGGCTNKKCSEHKYKSRSASFDQVEYIKTLMVAAEEPEELYNFKEMTENEADELIKKLKEDTGL